jgi:hypothetical protein
MDHREKSPSPSPSTHSLFGHIVTQRDARTRTNAALAESIRLRRALPRLHAQRPRAKTAPEIPIGLSMCPREGWAMISGGPASPERLRPDRSATSLYDPIVRHLALHAHGRRPLRTPPLYRIMLYVISGSGALDGLPSGGKPG